MKTKIFLMLGIIMLSISACREDDKPIPEVRLTPNSVTMTVGESQQILISGGDGQNYSISPSSSEIVNAVISGNTLTITAKKEGEITLKISSVDREAPLKVRVNPAPVPDLGATVGIYNLEGKPLLSYKMVARSKNGLWLCESGANPYEKRIFLPYYREGEQKILIIGEGFPSPVINTPPEGRSFSVVVEKTIDNGEKIQLKTETFRLIVEKR